MVLVQVLGNFTVVVFAVDKTFEPGHKLYSYIHTYMHVTKRELSQKAELSIYQSIFIPILTCGQQ